MVVMKKQLDTLHIRSLWMNEEKSTRSNHIKKDKKVASHTVNWYCYNIARPLIGTKKKPMNIRNK